jgi:diketogulonate reductase-like aldo/keto reductase
MEYVQLGRSNTQVPKIGFGTWQYSGGSGVLHRAHELGAAFVDTAEVYGTEAQVAADLAGLREDFFIATKVSPQNLHHSDVVTHCAASLKRLATDRIDLYQVHWPNPDIPIAETMRAMAELIADGHVRHVGVSNYSVAQMQEAQDALGNIPLVSNQVKYSLGAREIEADILPYCQEHNITVIAYSPLAKGEFSGPGLKGVAGVARALGKTPAQIMLNWLIGQPQVIAIPKTDRVERVDEAVGAIGWTMSPEERAALTNS